MLHLIFSIPSWYVIARFVFPLAMPLMLKITLSLLVLLSSQYLLISRFTAGGIFSPEMPRALIILFNWAFGTVLFLAIIEILIDVVVVISFLVLHPLAIDPELHYQSALFAMVLSTIGVYQAIRVPPVKEVTIKIKDLPDEFEGYQLLQLTDLHITKMFNAAWTAKLVRKAMMLDVDLILITGDVIDGTLANRRKDVAPLKDLYAPDGVFAITGNHEYFFEQQRWTDHLATLGLQPLLNSHTIIKRNEAELAIAGLPDLSASRRDAIGSDIEKALKGIPEHAPVVLLDHQPRNARQNAAQKVDLQLSGHTHGGLIIGFDRLFSKPNAGFVSGLYDVDGMQLYVNNGTALWPGLALRLGRASELTRITLERRLLN